MTDEKKAPKRENIWLNIGLNVIIPSILMSKGKKWFDLEPEMLLVVALAFPVAYGIYDFVVRKKYNFFSVLGFVSILISGGVGILELKKDWIAIKEAAIPALFGIAVLASLYTPFPLVRTFLYNPDIFDVAKIESALQERNNESAFEKLLVRCTIYLVASFVLSAILNYALAKYTIRSETGTDAFVAEMGKMTALSWPVVALPATAVMMIALFQLVKGIQKYTGYEIDDILLIDAPKKDDAEDKVKSVETDGSGMLSEERTDSSKNGA
jgi:intracellular septation protein A